MKINKMISALEEQIVDVHILNHKLNNSQKY